MAIYEFPGMDRIFFGADGPYMELVVSNAKWVRLIRDLPENAPKGIRFTQDEVDAILGGNAKKFLGL
jgi:predicted TIM-barrel fold metal-dependent hydrolase